MDASGDITAGFSTTVTRGVTTAVTSTMNLSSSCPTSATPRVDIEAMVAKYTSEFGDRIDADVIRYVVQDSHDRLIEHVPRTLYVYLVPWVRNRLERRVACRPEPTLTEVLLAPPHRL